MDKLITPFNSKITLYCDESDINSHFIRFVLNEKDIVYNNECVYINSMDELPEVVAENNFTNKLPILYDRDHTIYDIRVITEYLDERFPYQSVMTIDPISRAYNRQLLYRFCYGEDSLYVIWNKIISPDTKDTEVRALKQKLRNYLVDLLPAIQSSEFFGSDQLTIVDICLGPLLWRLNSKKITLPKEAVAFAKYSKRLFDRKSFSASLSTFERYLYK